MMCILNTAMCLGPLVLELASAFGSGFLLLTTYDCRLGKSSLLPLVIFHRFPSGQIYSLDRNH